MPRSPDSNPVPKLPGGPNPDRGQSRGAASNFDPFSAANIQPRPAGTPDGYGNQPPWQPGGHGPGPNYGKASLPDGIPGAIHHFVHLVPEALTAAGLGSLLQGAKGGGLQQLLDGLRPGQKAYTGLTMHQRAKHTAVKPAAAGATPKPRAIVPKPKPVEKAPIKMSPTVTPVKITQPAPNGRNAAGARPK